MSLDWVYQYAEEKIPKFTSHYSPITSNSSLIPQFYSSCASTNCLRHIVRQLAYKKLLVNTINEESNNFYLLTDNELENLWDLILSNLHAHSNKISYMSYRKIGQTITIGKSEFITKILILFFSPTTWSKFISDQYGLVRGSALFHYIVRMIRITSTFFKISSYIEISDITKGFIAEEEFKKYLQSEIESFSVDSNIFSNMNAIMFKFYLSIAARKFYFFHGNLRRERKDNTIKVLDIVSSPILSEFLEIKYFLASGDTEQVCMNWFHPRCSLQVYSTFIELDKDSNNLLNKEELKHYGNSFLSYFFVSRLLEEYSTNGEMNFRQFVDFELAIRYKNTRESLKYFFNVLDYQHRGYLTLSSLNSFLKEIIPTNQPAQSVEDVCNEIFDLVRPEDPTCITLKDLINSHSGGNIISYFMSDPSIFLQQPSSY